MVAFCVLITFFEGLLTLMNNKVGEKEGHGTFHRPNLNLILLVCSCLLACCSHSHSFPSPSSHAFTLKIVFLVSGVPCDELQNERR